MIELPSNRIRRICESKSDIQLAKETLLRTSLIANDVETIPYKRSKKNAKIENFTLTVVSFSCLEGDFGFPLQNGYSPTSGIAQNIEDMIYAIRDINASGIPHVGQNFSYDAQWYIRFNMPVKNWAYDTMVMFWSRYPELPKTLDFIASILLDDYRYWKSSFKNQSWDYYLEYGMDDTKNTLRICLIMMQWLDEHPWILRNFTHAMLRCYASTKMNAVGAYIDESMLTELEIELRAESEAALDRLRFLIDDSEFNPNSAPQKKELLYGIIGAQPRNTKGRPIKDKAKASTGAVPMRLIKQEGPIQKRIVNAIDDVQKPTKQISNVIKMPHIITPSNKRLFLTFFDGVGTIGTRLASRASPFGHGGNAQNIRKKYRKFVRARPNHFFWEIDFSGADAVYVAYESEEPAMIEVFEKSLDSHAMTAKTLFHQWTYEQLVAGKKAGDPAVIDPITGVRQIGKKISHGANYLMAAYTLLMTATIPTIVGAAIQDGYKDAMHWTIPRLVEYCELLESRYRNGYPRLKRSGEGSWYMDLQRELVESRRIETIYGFTLPILGDPKAEDTLRVAAAMHGQANTAGRTNAALTELSEGVRTIRFRDGMAPDCSDQARPIDYDKHGVYPLLQVHDSLIFECNALHPNLAEGLHNIERVMTRPFLCKGREFRLGIEGEINLNWAKSEAPADSAQDVLSWLDNIDKKTLVW